MHLYYIVQKNSISLLDINIYSNKYLQKDPLGSAKSIEKGIKLFSSYLALEHQLSRSD